MKETLLLSLGQILAFTGSVLYGLNTDNYGLMDAFVMALLLSGGYIYGANHLK